MEQLDPLFKIHSIVYSLTLKFQKSIHAWERTYHRWSNLYISRAHNILGAHGEAHTYRINIFAAVWSKKWLCKQQWNVLYAGIHPTDKDHNTALIIVNRLSAIQGQGLHCGSMVVFQPQTFWSLVEIQDNGCDAQWYPTERRCLKKKNLKVREKKLFARDINSWL
jgi:hypothetical protein